MEVLRDEYIDYMTFRNVRRPLFTELFGPLIGLEDEWRQQGASEEEVNLRAFGFDYVRRHGVRCNTGAQGAFDLRTGEVSGLEWAAPPFTDVFIEETADHVIRRDRFGRTTKLCKGSATIALPLDYPVKDFESWLRIKPMFEFRESRMGDGWAEAAREARRSGALIVAAIPGGFDMPRELMGDAQACLAYYTQPHLMHDMLETVRDTVVKVLQRVVDEVQIDQLSVHEDMAGKSGPLIGPAQMRDFVTPYYEAAWDVARSNGCSIFQVDSDGNVNAIMDSFLEAGVTSVYPMEPAAGMDVVELRKEYGRQLAMLGGIDKHVLRKSREDIRAELEYKMQPLMRQGGMVFGLDHRIPNGTPLENYRCYVRSAREILGLDPAPEPGWARMAF